MKVSELLQDRIGETLPFVIQNPNDISSQTKCIMDNQIQIMRGLRALLKGGFEPYDDEGEDHV